MAGFPHIRRGIHGWWNIEPTFSGEDGHFVDFTPLVCPNDAEAIEKAKRLVNGRDVELWNGARPVIKLDCKPR
jgi:hypothetical protein